jgi:hypothetical protein
VTRLETAWWLLVAALAVALLVVVMMWAVAEPLPPDCDLQRTAGNWQPACESAR